MNKLIIILLFLLVCFYSCFLVAKTIDLDTGSDLSKQSLMTSIDNSENRNVFSNIGTSSLGDMYQLTYFNYHNLLMWAGNKDNLAKAFSSDITSLESDIASVLALDHDNENDDESLNYNVTNMCNSNFEHSLNFKPIIVNYGNNKVQEQRVLVGTNTGFLHMFKNQGDTIEEAWVFIPNELFKSISKLKENNTSSDKVHGIDGTGTVHIQDVNSDGVINEGDGDKVWFYFGLGRGGQSYYALDISHPDKPKLMWHINNNTLGFSELAQTWAKVNIGFSKINQTTHGQAKPVAFFPAGYDKNKDNVGIGTNDNIGRGLYIVDAETGQLLFSATPALTGGRNLQWPDITDSIASSLALMDSNSDGFIDRIYVGDTGANVWRIDMPNAQPFNSSSPWTVHKLAQLGNNRSDDSNNTNVSVGDERRFFNEPTIARAIMPYTVQTITNISGSNKSIVSTANKPYDVVLLGSGNKASLLSDQTNDQFFMLKDANIMTQSFSATTQTILTPISAPKPKVITATDLYNFTNSTYGQLLFTQPKPQFQPSELLAINQSSGWLINYVNRGEKSVASGLVLSGVVYFNSYTPSATSTEQTLCEGIARSYAVDLLNASIVYDYRREEVEGILPDTPQVVLLEQADERENESSFITSIDIDVNTDTDIDTDVNNNPSGLINNILAVCDVTGCINKLPTLENAPPSTPVLEVNNATPATSKNITLNTIRTSLYIQEAQ